MKQLMMGFAACALLLTGCTEQDITERVIDGQGQLNFSTGIGKQATKTAELTNTALREAAKEKDKGIALKTYEDTAPIDGTYKKWFVDELRHLNGEWKIETTRFRNTVPTKFVTYFPKSTKLVEVGTTFNDADFDTKFPAFTYTVASDPLAQEDLIAGITNVAANQKDITIGLRHILSQVNFGTRGYNGAKISIRNIKIEGLYESAKYIYKAEDTYPIGDWKYEKADGSSTDKTSSYNYHNYTYAASTFTHPTTPAVANTGDIYVFGDGGNWGPGKETNVFYPAGTDLLDIWQIHANKVNDLKNSLMLMPQDFTGDTDGKAKVTFEYTITDTDDAYVAGSGTQWEKGEFKLNFNTTPTTPTNPKPDKHYIGKWEQNYRYLYLIDFTDFLDGSALTFKVDVEMYPWENYDGEGGIINIMAAGQPTTANMDKITNGKPWYIASQSVDAPNDPKFNPAKWAQVIRDEAWDLSTYDFTSIVVGNTFNLNFQNVIFNTKEPNTTATTIALTLPDGFSVTSATIQDVITVAPDLLNNKWTISKGNRSNTAAITITNNSYYRTSDALKGGIEAATAGMKFGYGGTQAIDLTTMVPPAALTLGDKITVKFNSLIVPTVGATTDGIWTWNATTKTATWTKVAWKAIDAAKTDFKAATTNAVIYCSDDTVIDLTAIFGEPGTPTNSPVHVVFSKAATRTSGAGTDNGVWTYSPASKTATWTKNP